MKFLARAVIVKNMVENNRRGEEEEELTSICLIRSHFSGCQKQCFIVPQLGCIDLDLRRGGSLLYLCPYLIFGGGTITISSWANYHC